MKNLLALICIVLSLGTAKAQLYTMNVYVHDSVETGPWVSYCQSTIENVTFYTTPQSPLLTTLNIFRTGGDVTIIQVSLIDSITYTPGCEGEGVSFDGYTYSSVVIGNQEWMAENLRTSKYRNGDAIPNITDNNEWAGLTSGAWAHNDNDSLNEDLFGKLYNWYAVADARNICPAGWHVPTDNEWITLIDYLGGYGVAGGKMKTVDGWNSPNAGATNESGFSAVPGGWRYDDGYFYPLGFFSQWWTSTEYNASDALYRNVSYDYSNASGWYYSKKRGFSVRCVKD